MQELKNKISQIEMMIQEENASIAELTASTKVDVGVKEFMISGKKRTIEGLIKMQGKEEAALEKALELDAKEQKLAPLKKLMSEINQLKSTLDERKMVLLRATGAYELDRKDSAKRRSFQDATVAVADINHEMFVKKEEMKMAKNDLKAVGE